MNITITGRHLTVTETLQEYAERKIEKLEQYFQQLIDAHVILYLEKLDRGAEVVINGDGIQFHGREKAETFFSAIDLLVDKMEKQIVKYKEKHQMHKGARGGEAAGMVMGYEETAGKAVRLNQVSNKPIDRIEAYFQMKNNATDFFLFKRGVSVVDSDEDYSNKSYAALYRDKDKIKMVEIPFEDIKEHRFEHDTFTEYELEVLDDSLVKPKIKFRKVESSQVRKMTLDEAIKEIEKNGAVYMPFFNVESQYFNVIYKNGKDCEVMVPAF